MTTQLEDLGIRLTEPMLVEHYYSEMRAIFIHDLGKPDKQGMILDLDSLPPKPQGLKEAVIRWIISINLTRLNHGDPPIVTLETVLKCPVWRIVRPPLKRLTLTKEKLFNKPTIKPVGSIGPKSLPGSINKR